MSDLKELQKIDDERKEIDQLEGMAIVFREMANAYEGMANMMKNKEKYTNDYFDMVMEGYAEVIINLNAKAQKYK